MGLAFLVGAILGVGDDDSGEFAVNISGIAAWPLYVLTYLWIKADARERGITPPAGSVALVVPLLLLSAPYYLLASRPGWYKLASLAFFLGFLALLAAACWAGSYLGSLLAT